MGRKALQRVSQREYARQLGISNEAVSKAIREGKIQKGWDSKANKIIVEHATQEWGALHMKTNVTRLLQQEPGEPPMNERSYSQSSLTLNGDSSFADAKRVREIIQAQLAALDLKERKEELVKKDEVYKQLFAFGQQLRISITAIPDRILDSLLAAKNRAEAHQLLSGEIHGILDGLTKSDFNFSPRQ